MYRAGEASPRLRSVEVARGRAGYGFTLSGQAPCMLSGVMRGGPADLVGLRAGDQILAVDNINVRRASHEDVVKLIGKCSGVLHMVVAGTSHPESCSSDEELGLCEGRGRPKARLDSKALGINRAKRVVEEMQSGGILSMMFEHPAQCPGTARPPWLKAHSLSELPAAAAWPNLAAERGQMLSPGHLSPKEEQIQILYDDSVFGLGPDTPPDDLGLDASILNVAMVVGYLGSIELPSVGGSLEANSLQAIRGCLRRLRAEQKIHSLVAMKVLHDRVRLCSDRAAVLAEYPAEKLAFSAVCPDDRRLFGLVTMQTGEVGSLVLEEEGALRTSCHVFMVDPDLFQHKIHQGIARRFGFECTADPDTSGCLEFPASSLPVLQFVSVLYRDMGELMDGVRARAFADGEGNVPHHASTSSNSDSGIGNFQQEERSSRVLVVDLGASAASRHGMAGGSWESTGGWSSQPWGVPWNSTFHDPNELNPLDDRCWDLSQNPGPISHGEGPPAALRSSMPPARRSAMGPGGTGGLGQRWFPTHVLQDWQCGHASDQESYTDSTDGWSSINCGTLPPPMNKIPADRYRLEGSLGPSGLGTQKRDWPWKAFGVQNVFSPHRNVRKTKEDRMGPRLGRGVNLAQTAQRPATRRSFTRAKRFSITRSLDDLESAAVSDGELSGGDLKDCVSTHSLSSNTSLPSVQSCRRRRDRRVASWAVSFERLLQDPLGVQYFSDFLRKEFSEENILFWQACEGLTHVPAHDQKELSYRARDIFSRFLGSKATTPVNIDSQAQLADDILETPHPEMFKEQQLQIFNLMKFDSYTRFLKSPLYQACILAEVEGRSLPDAQKVPSSPASRHGSDHSNVSTPKKQLSSKSRSGRSLDEEPEEEGERQRRGPFFSWSRARSTGRSQKKKELGDHSHLHESPHANGGMGRRESQASVSSAGSLDLSDSSRVPATEWDRGLPHCCVQLPDGSACMVLVRAGLSIKELLAGLCERHGLNGAAVDLFLLGGDKPLVLHQDSSVLESRELRLEKRTLFRLDLIPINRSVGLKAKPTKPVTEVLRPVVAKYGLRLNELVARLSGEQEPLDLGAPIASLDGQRVILEEKEPCRGRAATEKPRGVSSKHGLAASSSSRNPSTLGEGRAVGKSNSIKIKGENGKNAREPRLSKREESIAKIGKKKSQKINLDEAEEFFELISKAQSSRADDQRGLLRKEDLVLPAFLRLPPGATEHPGGSPTSSPSSADSDSLPAASKPPRGQGGAGGALEGAPEADLTLTGEGDISSPNSSLLPPPPTPQDAGPPRPGGGPCCSRGLLSSTRDEGVAGSGSSKPLNNRPPQSDLPALSPSPGGTAKAKASPHHATFV